MTSPVNPSLHRKNLYVKNMPFTNMIPTVIVVDFTTRSTMIIEDPTINFWLGQPVTSQSAQFCMICSLLTEILLAPISFGVRNQCNSSPTTRIGGRKRPCWVSEVKSITIDSWPKDRIIYIHGALIHPYQPFTIRCIPVFTIILWHKRHNWNKHQQKTLLRLT